MRPKDPAGIANSVDPDQTARTLIWVCTVCPDLSVQKLRNITVRMNAKKKQKQGLDSKAKTEIL